MILARAGGLDGHSLLPPDTSTKGVRGALGEILLDDLVKQLGQFDLPSRRQNLQFDVQGSVKRDRLLLLLFLCHAAIHYHISVVLWSASNVFTQERKRRLMRYHGAVLPCRENVLMRNHAAIPL